MVFYLTFAIFFICVSGYLLNSAFNEDDEKIFCVKFIFSFGFSFLSALNFTEVFKYVIIELHTKM